MKNIFCCNPPRFIRPLILLLGCLPLVACSLFENLGSAKGTPTLPAVLQVTQSARPTMETVAAVTSETPVPAARAQPTADASGLKVVYVKNGNLWRWTPKGAVQLTHKGAVYSPLLSPDGQVVAFTRPADEFHLEIWAVNLDGSGERRLVSVSDLDTAGASARDPNAVAVNPYKMAWIPGTQTLAFNTHQIFQGPGLSMLNDLNTVDSASGKVTNLLLAGWGGMFYYSPDGRQVAISQPEKIFIANADGSNYRSVFNYEPVNTYSDYRFYARPAWLPDASALRAAIPPADPLAAQPKPTVLWTIPADGSQPHRDGQVQSVPLVDQPVSYSPDLKRIAYIRQVGQPAENRRELHLAAFDGGGDWLYATALMAQFSGWAPDDQHFAYVVGENQEPWAGNLQTAAIPLSGAPAGLTKLRWVDGQRYLFVGGSEGNYELALGVLDGQPVLVDSLLNDPPAFDFWRPGEGS